MIGASVFFFLGGGLAFLFGGVGPPQIGETYPFPATLDINIGHYKLQ